MTKLSRNVPFIIFKYCIMICYNYLLHLLNCSLVDLSLYTILIRIFFFSTDDSEKTISDHVVVATNERYVCDTIC